MAVYIEAMRYRWQEMLIFWMKPGVAVMQNIERVVAVDVLWAPVTLVGARRHYAARISMLDACFHDGAVGAPVLLLFLFGCNTFLLGYDIDFVVIHLNSIDSGPFASMKKHNGTQD